MSSYHNYYECRALGCAARWDEHGMMGELGTCPLCKALTVPEVSVEERQTEEK